MGANSKIEWTDHTWNPWIGCSKVGPGCDHCYAEAWDRRFAVSGHAMRWGANKPRTRTSADNWRQPLKWNAQAQREGRRYRVFCASLADVFDNEVPVEWRVELFKLIRSTPHLDWLLLTKRIGNAAAMMRAARGYAALDMTADPPRIEPLPNVWLGATIVNQEEADRDIPKLLAVPAAKRFLSMEPLLGPVDISSYLCDFDLGNGSRWGNLHWVIVGGESGPGARPFDTAWAHSIVEQCSSAGVACFLKQLGAHVIQGGERRMKRDKKGGDMSEWPHEIRVREVPDA